MEGNSDFLEFLDKTNYELLKWNELVEIKRRISSKINEISEEIVKMKEDEIKKLNSQIHQLKLELDEYVFKYRNTKDEISETNLQLEKNSEDIAKTKNMLSLLESRMENETEEELLKKIKKYEETIEKKDYSGENEKNNIVSLIKNENMKLEAIRVVNNLKANMSELSGKSDNIQKEIKNENEILREIDSKIKEIKNNMSTLYNHKSELSRECEEKINVHNSFFPHLEKINKRLDVLSKIRKEIGNFGKGVNNQEIINVIDNAKKKLEKGSKMSLEELKLAYNDRSD